MNKFYCENCNKIFEAEGEKREWESAIYGYCFKRIAQCPTCKSECQEYHISWSFSTKSSRKPSCGACGGGCGSCL